MAYNYQSAKTQKGRDALIAFSTGWPRIGTPESSKNAPRLLRVHRFSRFQG